jgi:hypothetical protein
VLKLRPSETQEALYRTYLEGKVEFGERRDLFRDHEVGIREGHGRAAVGEYFSDYGMGRRGGQGMRYSFRDHEVCFSGGPGQGFGEGQPGEQQRW